MIKFTPMDDGIFIQIDRKDIEALKNHLSMSEKSHFIQVGYKNETGRIDIIRIENIDLRPII